MAPDKQKHFIAGVLIALVVSLFFAPWVGAAVATVAGILKEVYDCWKNAQARKAGLLPPHSVELLDFAYTALGGIVSSLVISYTLH